MKGLILIVLLMSACGGASLPSICEIPIAHEEVRCPWVAERRSTIADDGSWATCRIFACGEDRVWRWRNGIWKNETVKLR
jgi:hypothetical protein